MLKYEILIKLNGKLELYKFDTREEWKQWVSVYELEAGTGHDIKLIYPLEGE